MQRSSILALVIAAAMVGILALIGFLGDLYWFTAVGYESVFLTILLTRIVLFVVAFGIFFGFSYGNVLIAARKAAGTRGEGPPRLQLPVILAGIGLSLIHI